MDFRRIITKIVSFGVLSVAMAFVLDLCGVPSASYLMVVVAYCLMLVLMTIALDVAHHVPIELVKDRGVRDEMYSNVEYVTLALICSLVVSFGLLIIALNFSIEAVSLTTVSTIFSFLVTLSALIDLRVALENKKRIKELCK